MIIERFFRVIADSKSLLALGSDGEFVLTLTLFKMMEALEIKDINMMIRSLEKELQGVEVTEIMVTTPDQDSTLPNEVITITEDEIVATLPVGNSEKAQEETPVAGSKLEGQPEPAIEATEEIVDSISTTPSAEGSQTEVPTAPAKPAPETFTESETTFPERSSKTFDELIAKIYDRSFELGECFKRNIEFESFKDGELTWGSTAEGDDKKQLITHWGVINMFVKELFGYETKIINIAKKKTVTTSDEQLATSNEQENLSQNETQAAALHNDADSASMVEDIEMKSSCIAPDSGDTEAAKEKDPSTLLEEPMIKEAIALFDPKKVRIKRNS